MAATCKSPPNSSPPPSPPPTPLQFAKNLRRDPLDMQILPASPASSFELPDGWTLEIRPRPNSSFKLFDKYYYEPGTGRMFRSLASIKRYLTGEEELSPKKKPSTCLVPYQNSGSFRRVVYGGKLWRPDELEDASHRSLDDIVPTTLQHKAFSLLPDGWIVEEVPRKTGFRSDRYFIEPRTGQKFRSAPEVQRYLKGEKGKSRCRTLSLSNRATAPRRPAQRKKHKSIKMLKDAIIDMTNPPTKINWIFSGDGTDNWSPLLEECVLPNYVKEQWEETFLLGMNGWKQRVPQLTMGSNDQE